MVAPHAHALLDGVRALGAEIARLRALVRQHEVEHARSLLVIARLQAEISRRDAAGAGRGPVAPDGARRGGSAGMMSDLRLF